MSSKISKFFLSHNYGVFMYCCCLAYCATAMPKLGVASDFKTIVLIGSLPVVYIKFYLNEIDKNIIYLLILSIVIQVVSWVNSTVVIPDEAKNYPDIKLLTTLFLFSLMSIWINGDRFRQRILYITLIVSFVITAVYDLAFNGGFLIWKSGYRIDYGLHNAQYTTMISAIVIILTVYLFCTTPKPQRSRWHYSLTILVIAFSIFSLIVSQSRQVWLGLLVMGAVYPIMFSLIFKAGRKQVFAIYAILILLSVAFFSNNNVRNRALIESDVIANIATLEWENIPMSSVGIRFNSWVESSKWIRENPIIGTSKESIHLVIKHSEKFQQSKAKDVGHLHNYYLETLVAFGIIGLVFIFVYYAYIFIVIKNKGSKEEFLLLSSFLVFWLVINNFESFNSKYYGLYIQNIVLAGIFVMNRKDKKVAEGIDDVD